LSDTNHDINKTDDSVNPLEEGTILVLSDLCTEVVTSGTVGRDTQYRTHLGEKKRLDTLNSSESESIMYRM